MATMADIENPVTLADVTSRAFRTLTTAEQATASTLVDDAWYLLLGSTVGGMVSAMFIDPEGAVIEPVDPTFLHNLKRMCANAVLRVVNNPNGNLEEEGDDYRARRDVVTSSGRLYFLEDEIAELFPSEGPGNAFTIRPGGTEFLRPPLPDNAFWDPIA